MTAPAPSIPSPLLHDLDRKNFLRNYGERDFHFVRGKGSYVWDADGRKYLDCIAGVAVNAFGHCHGPIVDAIKAQLDKFIHASNLYLLETQQTLASLLLEFTGYDRAFLCNSGTESNEAAIKFARKYWVEEGKSSRINIISLSSSFHGRTYASMAATGQEKIRKGFGPLPAGFITVPVNDVETLKASISEETAAILFEPILAEGGIISLSNDFARVLEKIQADGVLLIADEIQVGLGRTGAFLASPGLGLSPDISTLAKPLGGGLPLGAVLMGQKVASAIRVGEHGSTFGGNPVACAAGIAVIRELTRTGFLESVRERSGYLRANLNRLISDYNREHGEVCGPLLGQGFLTGFSYALDLSQLLFECRKNGLLIYRAGQDVVRLLPPLNISREEIDELMKILNASLPR